MDLDTNIHANSVYCSLCSHLTTAPTPLKKLKRLICTLQLNFVANQTCLCPWLLLMEG